MGPIKNLAQNVAHSVGAFAHNCKEACTNPEMWKKVAQKVEKVALVVAYVALIALGFLLPMSFLPLLRIAPIQSIVGIISSTFMIIKAQEYVDSRLKRSYAEGQLVKSSGAS